MSGDKEILCGYPRGAISAEAMKEMAKSFSGEKDNRYEAIISLAKERDTYRELCEELKNRLIAARFMFAVYGINLKQLGDQINESITKAEAILGEKNGTSN
jgi:hypothetical protein